jgi:hypothetical protein
MAGRVWVEDTLIFQIPCVGKTMVNYCHFDGEFEAGKSNLNELEPRICGKA